MAEPHYHISNPNELLPFVLNRQNVTCDHAKHCYINNSKCDQTAGYIAAENVDNPHYANVTPYSIHPKFLCFNHRNSIHYTGPISVYFMQTPDKKVIVHNTSKYASNPPISQLEFEKFYQQAITNTERHLKAARLNHGPFPVHEAQQAWLEAHRQAQQIQLQAQQAWLERHYQAPHTVNQTPIPGPLFVPLPASLPAPAPVPSSQFVLPTITEKKDEFQGEGGYECKICMMKRERKFVFLDCFHGGMCIFCIHDATKNNSLNCHICRTKVAQIKQIYI